MGSRPLAACIRRRRRYHPEHLVAERLHALLRVRLQLFLLHPAELQRVLSARLAAAPSASSLRSSVTIPTPGKLRAKQRLQFREQRFIRRVRPLNYCRTRAPTRPARQGVLSANAAHPPTGRGVELPAIAHGRRAVRVQRVLAREVDEERGARLREAQRAVVRRDHVRVHRGLHALRESAVAARRACTPRAGVQKREQRGRVLDDAEAVRRGARVEHAVPCLYAAAHSDARRVPGRCSARPCIACSSADARRQRHATRRRGTASTSSTSVQKLRLVSLPATGEKLPRVAHGAGEVVRKRFRIRVCRGRAVNLHAIVGQRGTSVADGKPCIP